MPTSPMLRSGFSHLMYPGLNEAYLLAFNEYPEEYTKFLNIEPSTKMKEEELVVAGFGLVPEKGAEGGVVPLWDVMKMSDKIEYLHKTYVMGYECSEELLEDEQYGILRQASRALAVAVKQTLDVLGAIPLNYAFNSSYKGVDGKALCATDHPLAKVPGASVANEPAVACDFDPVALKAALETWETWVNDNDLPLLIQPKYVVSGPYQRDIITKTLGSTQQPFTGDNEINAVREWGLEKMILHYLTDTDAWWILSRPADHFMKWFWRVRPTFRNFDDPDTGNARYITRFRASVGYTHWWGVYGSPGI